ncbi:unnamed protein product [Sphagnum jensenii]|uniref:Uncharacterized protein n=1 Tax=Sphagnum jensenii TaxID=128206 RepID=A0ABP0W433_9BRYO
MKSDVPLDYAIFHLTPTRTRCELLVASGKEKERLATGLIKPFLTHLKAVEDQISNGCCSSSSITLQPPPSTTNTFGDTNANASKKKDPPPPPPHDAPWFTKGTVERFVRFVSTPEVLEFVSSVEDELTQIEEAISLRAMESPSPSSWGVMSFALHPTSELFYTQVTTSIIRQVACAMDARRLVLHKEQGIAFTRAAAAGFDVQHMAHLLAFADCFGATRLRDACVKFMALCKKRQEACNYIEEMESEAMNSERLCLPVSARSDGSLVRHSRGQYADRQSEIHGNLRDPEASNNENDISSRSHCRLFNDGQAFVGDVDMDAHSRGISQKSNHHHHHHQRRRSALPFGVLHGSSGATVTTNGDYLSHGHTSHVFPAFFSSSSQSANSSRNSCSYNLDSDFIYPLESSCKPNSLRNNQLGPRPNQEGSGCVNGNGSQGHVQNLSLSMMLASDQNWQLSSRHTSASGISHSHHVQVQQNTQGEGCGGHIPTTHMERKNAVAMDAACTNTISGVVTEMKWDEVLEHESQLPSKHDPTAAVLANSNVSWQLIPALPSPKQKALSAVQQPAQAGCSSGVRQQQHPGDKKHPRQQEPCRVSSTGTPRTSLSSSSVFEKPVLRRWSQIAAGNNSDCSHIETEQQSKDLCRSSPEDSCTKYDTTMVNILPEPHQSTESFRPGVIKVVVSEASTIAPGMHGGEFSRMSVDSVLPPDSLAKYAAARSALLCSSGPDNDSSCYQEAHAEEEKDFVALVESEGQKTRTVAKDQELVQPALPSFVLDASNTAVASQAASAEDNSSNQLRTGIQQEVELPDGDQHSSLLKESKFSMSENSPSIPPASDTDDGSLALNTAANQKSVSEFHHEENNGDVKHVVGVVKGETNSPQEPKGRFYEHYRERRDAKLREEPGSKRAEREAKLKAMHEVLEKRKEEMVACNNNNSKMVPEKLHSAASVDTQLHAEKLHNFKPELAIGRKSKRQQLSSPKQNVVHKLSSPQKFFPGSSPHVNMNVMSPASAAVPGAPKLSSRAASQRWSATALVNSTTSGEILLGHSSGPCVAELRKENTKPLAVRSSTLHERKLVNKTISGTVLRSSTAPLEANRSQPAAVVSFNVYEDKKSWNSSMRRSLSLVSADLLQEAPPTVSQTPALKISKYLMVEQNNMTNKPMKHMAAAYCQAVTPDAKPFLRKGRGIGPGAGAAGVRKSKVVPGSPDPAKFLNEDIAIVTSLPLEDVIPRSGDLSMDTLKPEHHSATSQVAAVNEVQAVVETIPALEVSLSPQASSSSFGTTTAARSRRKWGCAEKMQPPIIIMSKESPKGIRKLLKFGRKSRNSGCSFPSSTANDWHETASTTTTTASDAEDADLELNNRMSFSNLTKRLERSWKNGGPQLLLHKGGRSVSAVRESSSSSSKAADSTAARSNNHAPRSFFSLSTFRSRSNESKSRS